MNIHIENDFATNLFNDVKALLHWRPEIEKGLAEYKSLYTFTSIIQLLLTGERIFLYNDKAFVILQPEQRPLGRLVNICMIGGNKEGFQELQDNILRFARSMDACQIVGIGRKGLSKWITEDFVDTDKHYFMKEL